MRRDKSFIEQFKKQVDFGLYVEPGKDEIFEARRHWMNANSRIHEIFDLFRYSNLSQGELLELVERRLKEAQRIMRYGVEYLWQFDAKRNADGSGT